MSTSLELKVTSSTGTKTFTIPNPVPRDDYDNADVNTFIVKYNQAYDSDCTLKTANYVTRTYEQVYPEA